MNPLAAVWRWVKAGLYLITGQIDKSRRALDKNPTVMKAKFDDVIKSKVDQISSPFYLNSLQQKHKHLYYF